MHFTNVFDISEGQMFHLAELRNVWKSHTTKPYVIQP